MPLKKTKNHCISHFTFHSWAYVAVGHCVCLANCELSVNSGLISIVIVIVIVIGCHLLPLFFLKSGTLIFGFFGIIISNVDTLCLRHAFVVPSLVTTS